MKPIHLPFEILLTKTQSPDENMQADIRLLESLEHNPRIALHFYSWESPSATYGYFLDPSLHFKPEAVQDKKIQIARRPTGGGIIFHHCDLAFSVLIPSNHPGFSPNTLSNYALVNNAIADAIQQFLGDRGSLELLKEEKHPKESYLSHFCMAQPTKYDVILHGRKVGGGAQRRTKNGLLHQGTICLYLPEKKFLEEVLLHPEDVAETMSNSSWPLLGHTFDLNRYGIAYKELQFLLIESIKAI